MSVTDEDRQWIEAKLERLETTLLTEFQKFAGPNAVSDRVTKLEDQRPH